MYVDVGLGCLTQIHVPGFVAELMVCYFTSHRRFTDFEYFTDIEVDSKMIEETKKPREINLPSSSELIKLNLNARIRQDDLQAG